MFGAHSNKKQAFLVLMLYVLFGSLIFSILPAIGFHYLEGWRLLDAWYFTIITLTTGKLDQICLGMIVKLILVGFGDYAPSFHEGDVDASSLLKFFLEIYRTIVLGEFLPYNMIQFI